MTDLENLELLFSDSNEEILKAIYDKKDWMLRKCVRPGNLDYYIDDKGFKRFKAFEEFLNDTVPFEPLSKIENSINKLVGLNRAIFQTKIVLDDKIPFYIEYDFSKVDDECYKIMFPNFFYMHDEQYFKITGTLDDPINKIKTSIIGNEGDVCFILDDHYILNGVYYLPIVSKIYITGKIEEALFIELDQYCKNNHVPLEVIYENS